ncbi:GAF domain-containing protein [Rhodococcus sp. BP-252]|uniref:GAF domain-containing protein n=1 Tax=Rhodococcoides kyotonense TaxID=398843 RepID=A0A177YKC7_9NOCA|nr:MULTISPECIES: GAF domain-containing protein [Rhodococcus]MBY6410662.1 GAF domain-containing protein [Rhodococcus sp. BP-320]MBY6415513.1 GAF domain-containing protein [Rhodococcus sp. BP-321]MBY6420128.1 GAF domain-containing protein [Rhodococcus sp. BP-324]MBY6425218.1 GAF domain-containing protein [Rhodococcus sp. BP-323]MBY6430719.1 GAF domain-containing protein [Rhodococcus sp. BP-322]
MFAETPRSDAQLQRWLDALADIGEAVGGDEPVAALLERVAFTACDLLGYDFCAVFLPEAGGRALTIVGSHGLSADYIDQVNANRPILLDVRGADEAPTSIAFRTGEVVAIEDIAIEDIDEAPSIGPWGGVAYEQGYRALISVPLRRSGRVIGALNGYHANPHRFEQAEVSLVNAMATQVAVALGTAQLRVSEQDTIHELRRAEEVHDLLTAIALRGEGTSGVASTLADLLGRDVAIDDVYGMRLSGSETVSTADVSDLELRDGGVMRGPDDTTVTGVLLDGQVVAYIRVDTKRTVLSHLDIRAIEHAAVVTALELLRARTAAEVEQRMRGSLLADLLNSNGQVMAELLTRARRLGWDLSGNHHLIALRGTERSHPTTDELLAAADRFVARESPRPLAASYRGDFVIVWPESAGDVATFASRVLASIAGSGGSRRVHGGVTAAEPSERLPALFRTLRGALDLSDGTGVVDLREIDIDHLLLKLDDSTALCAFARATLGAAIDYDHEHGTDLLRTVRVLLDQDLDRRAVATELHLHPNTVAQRVRRFESLTGTKLGRPRDLLRITSALTVARIAGLASQL